MLYSEFISRLRTESKDLPKPQQYKFSGDGNTTLFQLGEFDFPILEDSYVYRLATVVQTEGSEFSLDIENGVLQPASAPAAANENMELDYKKVFLTDATWQYIVNYIIQDMQGDYFIEDDDVAWETSVENTIRYTTEDVMDVVDVYFKRSNQPSIEWDPLREAVNWRFSEQEQEIALGRSLEADYPLRLHALKRYVTGTSVSDTLPVQDRFLGVLQLGCMWQYYMHRLAVRTEIETKLAAENTITPLASLREQSLHYFRLYKDLKKRRKPAKPTRFLDPINIKGGRA